MSVASPQFDREAEPLRLERAASDPLNLLLDGVVQEVLNSCLLTATASSVANAALAKKAGCSERLVALYIPPPPTLFPQARLKLCTTPRTCSLAILLSCYFDRLSFLHELTRNRIEHECEAGSSTSFTAIARAWRMLAGDALEVLPEFGRLQVWAGNQTAAERAETVVDLLTEAEAGRWPCVDGHGVVNLPTWVERRAAQRSARNLQAFFTVGDSLQRACVINASRTGLCVLGLQGIWVGARLYLLFAPGRSIGGSVIWCKEGKAGIALDGDLPDDSQLIAHLH